MMSKQIFTSVLKLCVDTLRRFSFVYKTWSIFNAPPWKFIKSRSHTGINTTSKAHTPTPRRHHIRESWLCKNKQPNYKQLLNTSHPQRSINTRRFKRGSRRGARQSLPTPWLKQTNINQRNNKFVFVNNSVQIIHFHFFLNCRFNIWKKKFHVLACNTKTSWKNYEIIYSHPRCNKTHPLAFSYEKSTCAPFKMLKHQHPPLQLCFLLVRTGKTLRIFFLHLKAFLHRKLCQLG